MPWGDNSFGDSNGYGDGSGLFSYINSSKDFYRISNFDYTNLSSSVSQKTMFIDVDDISVFPAPPFSAIVDKEIIKVVNATGNTLIVERARENTLPANHASGAAITSSFTESVVHSVCDKFRNYDDIIYDIGTSTIKIQNADDLSLYYKRWETVTETGFVGLNLNYPTITDNQINDFYVSLTGTYYSNAIATSYARNASGLSSVTQSFKDGIKVYGDSKYVGSYQNRNESATSKLLKVLGTKSLATVDLKDFEYISVAEDTSDSSQSELLIKAISGSYDGHEIVLFNDSDTKKMRILHNGAGSLTGATTDENVLTPYPFNCLSIDPKGAMKLIYDGVKQAWRTLTNVYYNKLVSFETLKLGHAKKNSWNLGSNNSFLYSITNIVNNPRYTKLFEVWAWFINDSTDVNASFYQYNLCMLGGFGQRKQNYYLKNEAFDSDGDISSSDWHYVYQNEFDTNFSCSNKLFIEKETQQTDILLIKLVKAKKSYPITCDKYYIYWWIQKDKTVLVKRIRNNFSGYWKPNTFCDVQCNEIWYCVNCDNPLLNSCERSGTYSNNKEYYGSRNGSECYHVGYCRPSASQSNTDGVNYYGNEQGCLNCACVPTTTTTAGPTTTTTTTTTTTATPTTTTTTTAAPTYYFCFGGPECYPPQCVGPFAKSTYDNLTWCNVTGGFLSLAECQVSGCEATTTTTTVAPTTTTTTAAPVGSYYCAKGKWTLDTPNCGFYLASNGDPSSNPNLIVSGGPYNSLDNCTQNCPPTTTTQAPAQCEGICYYRRYVQSQNLSYDLLPGSGDNCQPNPSYSPPPGTTVDCQQCPAFVSESYLSGLQLIQSPQGSYYNYYEGYIRCENLGTLFS